MRIGRRIVVSGITTVALGLAAAPAAGADTQAGPRPCEARLAGMTAEEKVGQMVMAVTHDGPDGMPDDLTRRSLQDLKIGSVITSEPRTPGLAARYSNQVQRWARDTRLGLPVLMSGDFEFGTTHNVREGTTPLPNAMGLGAARDPRYAREAAVITAAEARAMGFHWNYAPVADVNTNPANPIIGVRSFGERTDLVRDLVETQVRAYHRAGLIATPKHFPGHGDTKTDSHLGLPSVDYDRATLDRVHLPPFRAAIAAGVDSIMTAHVVVKAVDPDLPATLSPKVLTGVLRNEMGFTGLIVTDAMDMDAIAKNWGTREATVMAVNAGADVIMSTGEYSTHVDAVDALLDALRDGRLTEARVDESVRRVLALKCEYDVAGARYVDPRAAGRLSGNAAFQRRALAMGVAGTTLVKNERGTLPFDPASGARTLVAGAAQVEPFAKAVDAASHGPVTAWQSATTAPTDAEIADAVRRAGDADRILVATYSSGPLPAGQAKLVRALQATGKPVAAIGIGLPYDIASYPDVPAYIATYGTTARIQRVDLTMHKAAAEVVFGRRPGGRLPVTIAGLYPYGHGLSY
ncbi:glycoside hydrolase family 3 C-terminal domain-containing protein [Actinomadura graeca]|uniref:beta-N-acetylhexosaminidase n=1 Tax=Actinomadura graeca TaxID=2750812 RepID=A0ABX8QSA4_9ACTN|nr:glycoside hydrolase family 3 protein [Actinomadura graeca]QXJ21617.1 glycoside hydrolase family 3 C-terminal domain-containing protein [Actinomadura graeca]